MKTSQNLSQYRIFYTVAAAGNISKAAKELFISQPAISKSIQKLEENLGCKLFRRSSRGVALTEEGNLLYSHVEKAFEAISQGEEKLRRSINLGAGSLKIGVSSTLCKYILLPYLKEFVCQYPHVRISISCQSTNKTLKLLEEDAIDIGLVGKSENAIDIGLAGKSEGAIDIGLAGKSEGAIDTGLAGKSEGAIDTGLAGKSENAKEIQFDFLERIEDVFVAADSYLQSLKAMGVQKDQILENSTLMLLDKGNMTRQYIDHYLQACQIEVKDSIDVSDMDLLIEFAKIGVGTACVIKDFVEQDLEKGVLREIPLKIPIRKREVGFVYKKHREPAVSLSDFIAFYHSQKQLQK